MQKEIKKSIPLLNKEGVLTTPGYAKKLLWEYDQTLISHSKLKIKEWDYYYIGNDKYAICLTIADNGYFGVASASIINFMTGKQHTKMVTKIFPLGKLYLPTSSESGLSEFKSKRVNMRFISCATKRELYCEFKNFHKGKTLTVNIALEESYDDSIVVATPFEDPKYFYYNQKINGLIPKGYATLGSTTYNFDDSFFGLLDWGRGVWTYNNTWYWASASAIQNGQKIGLNLGYGFGNTDAATENAFFLNGKMHKLKDVSFHIAKKNNKDDFLKAWKIKDAKGLINLTFTPVLNRHSDTNLLIIRSNQNQVFGYFSGNVVLNNNETFEINKMFGFAEKVHNKW